MKRSIPTNDQDPVDLLIVGGGIYGAAMAYYASLNSLNVALLEKDDFCSHTSANSQKVIHGGLRYLQSLDIKRVLESIRERQRFYKLFPHLIQPLPCVLPVSGFAMKSREAMGVAFWLYRLLQKMVCRGEFSAHLDKNPRMISVAEILAMFPHLQIEKLRGGALWYDGLCVEPERVVMGLLKSAAGRGAAIANYAKLTKIGRVDGILTATVKDTLLGGTTLIKARKIALCTGPWLKDTFGLGSLPEELDKLSLISGVNIITEPLTESGASIALKPRKPDKGGLMFVLPWKKYSIAGTVWEDGGETPSQSLAGDETKNRLQNGVHRSYPISGKAAPSIMKSHFGYVPGNSDETKEPADRILGHYKFIDREKSGKTDLLQVVGVKFTTVFDVSLKALAALFPERQLRETVSADELPVGSSDKSTEQILAALEAKYTPVLLPETLIWLFGVLGSELPRILEEYVFHENQKKSDLISHDTVLRGLSRFFIEEEMVVSLVDLIQRRLYSDTAPTLNENDLNSMASEMALLLNWSSEELEQEIKKAGNCVGFSR